MDYVYTDNGSGNNLLSDQRNFNGGAAGIPDDAGDKLILDGTWTDPIDIDVATTVGEIHIDSGYTGKATQNAKVTIDDSGVHNGNFTQEDGEWDQNGEQLDFDGDWDVQAGGTFTHSDGKVKACGTNQQILNETTFGDFEKNVSAAANLTFEQLKETTVEGELTLYGAAGQLLSLISSNPGTQWKLALTGTKGTINYLNVTDGDARNSDLDTICINPSNSNDLGNNLKWFSSIVETITENDHDAVKTAIETIDDTLYLKSLKLDGKIHIYSKQT